jgi:hypothetical protein
MLSFHLMHTSRHHCIHTNSFTTPPGTKAKHTFTQTASFSCSRCVTNTYEYRERRDTGSEFVKTQESPKSHHIRIPRVNAPGPRIAGTPGQKLRTRATTLPDWHVQP